MVSALCEPHFFLPYSIWGYRIQRCNLNNKRDMFLFVLHVKTEYYIHPTKAKQRECSSFREVFINVRHFKRKKNMLICCYVDKYVDMFLSFCIQSRYMPNTSIVSYEPKIQVDFLDGVVFLTTGTSTENLSFALKIMWGE